MMVPVYIVVRWQDKNGKVAREEREGKSGRVHRGRKMKRKNREGYREDKARNFHIGFEEKLFTKTGRFGEFMYSAKYFMVSL